MMDKRADGRKEDDVKAEERRFAHALNVRRERAEGRRLCPLGRFSPSAAEIDGRPVHVRLVDGRVDKQTPNPSGLMNSVIQLPPAHHKRQSSSSIEIEFTSVQNTTEPLSAVGFTIPTSANNLGGIPRIKHRPQRAHLITLLFCRP